VKISKIDNRKIQEINKTKSLFFEKINKTDKPYARLTKKKKRFKLLKSGTKKEHYY